MVKEEEEEEEGEGGNNNKEVRKRKWDNRDCIPVKKRTKKNTTSQPSLHQQK